jgi:hypothetical protein
VLSDQLAEQHFFSLPDKKPEPLSLDQLAEQHFFSLPDKKPEPLSLDSVTAAFRAARRAARARYDNKAFTFKVAVGGLPRLEPVDSCIVVSQQVGSPEVLCFPSPSQETAFQALRPGQVVVIDAVVSTRNVLMTPSLPAGMSGRLEDLHGAIQAAAAQPPREVPPPGGFTLRDAKLVKQ